ncbi:hypothetical protein [Candidatus Uabimicrobium amorphum]|uniref:Cytochrome c7-like domain-containing protein n=1 Tax=Uabimicrobium amorphum TaxID=2596890 RepID=A0A5S9F5F6_UABAM|nr:hypothetical protein [Candidatus Uabimicrobium amorphum]BBM86103.1 hypothetical protein UABAM_04489 [Candidatus Uabimicrobium amorphum]
MKISSIGIAIIVMIIAIGFHFSQLGQLTSAHAAIHNGEQSCHACHTQQKNPRGDALQCIVCHEQADRGTKLNVHGLPNEYFRTIAKRNYGPFAQRANDFPQAACATCHQEHQGRNFDLTKLNDRKCQTCHQQKFANFSSAHPEFARYPYKRRTNIMFDHATHFEDYFTHKKDEGVENIPDKCNACHVLNNDGQLMKTKTFEQTCAQCHDNDILKYEQDIDVIRFPGFLIEDFYAYSKELKMRPKFKKWPSIDEEEMGEATDFMRLLLSKDKELDNNDINEYLETYLFDLIAESPEEEDRNEIQAINAYVMMIKRLCDEIADEDNSALKKRLQKVLKVSMSDELLHDLFPDASNMLQVIRSRILPPIHPKHKERFRAFEFEEKELPTGWYFSDYTLRYRPRKHRDSMMKAWLDLMAKTYNMDKVGPGNNFDGNTHYVMNALNRCLKCHSVEKSEDRNSVLKINWKSSLPKYSPKFTRFSHRPHILAQMDCSSCHILNKKDFDKSTYDMSYENKDPKKFMNEFQFIEKDLCSKCHNHNVVGENCTSCHNYHAIPFVNKFTDNGK